MSTIEKNKVAGIHYVLKSDRGEVVDQSSEDNPMYYLHGHSNIVPGLEKALAGKAAGDHVSVAVPPEEGYGQRAGKSQKMRRSEFPDDAVIEKGARFVVRTRDGKAIPIWVTKVMGKTITVDHNHPLADKTLHFEVDVLTVRDATEAELEHGHAHGADGHAGHGHGEAEEGEDEDEGEDHEDEADGEDDDD